MSKIEDYAKEIPEEIRRAIRGLDSDYRAAIFVALLKHDELSFSELQKMLEIDKAMLNYHLGKLVESALVEHYYRHELGVDKYSFYSVTHFGQNFVEALSRFLRPEPISFRLPLRKESSTTHIDIGTFLWSLCTRTIPTDRYFVVFSPGEAKALQNVLRRAQVDFSAKVADSANETIEISPTEPEILEEVQQLTPTV